MPTLKDFEDQIAKTTNTSDQLTTGEGGGLAFKGKGARLSTYFTSSHEKADKALLQSFFNAMEEAYSAKAAMAGFKAAGLNHRIISGEPLSVKEATLAMRAARVQHERDIEASLTHVANTKHLEKHASREADARNWVPDSTFSWVKGAGLRLVTQDQGEFRLHHWNAKNNPDEPPPKTVELDALVEKEVAAIKAEREQLAKSQGRPLEPMSDRLIYLQAKLNLTERMVAEASLNLKPGGPAANVFLGPDMFFSPSDGPGVPGSCAKTTGGACTEEEMRQISEGLRRISARHPQITLMPGTIVWSRPVHPIPIIDGQPRPADMVYNTGPVYSEGSLAHMTYKMNDGGDANTTAIGLNGPGGSAVTPPSRENAFGARLQVFPRDKDTVDKLSADGKAKVLPILATMAKQAAPLSKDRDWELGQRPEDAGPRSSYNTIFTVGGKVMALEICRDNASCQAETEYRRVAGSDDPVARLAKAQPGPGGGANLHVLLAASTKLFTNNTICCTGGVVAYNDVSKGIVRSDFIKVRGGEHDIRVDPSKRQEMTTLKYDAPKTVLSSGAPKVGSSGGDVPSLERPSGSGILIEERAPSVREAMREGALSAPKAKIGVGPSVPEETTTTTVTTGVKSVRSESGLDKPKPSVSNGSPTISV